MGKKIKILYVDQEIYNLNAFKANFRTNYEIFLCQSESEGLKILKFNQIHVVITDQKMPSLIGIEFFKAFKSNYPEPVKIVVTAQRDIEVIKYAARSGLIFRYHEKPWSLEKLKDTIEHAYKAYAEDDCICK